MLLISILHHSISKNLSRCLLPVRSRAQALVLVCGQAPNLRDSALFADPLFAVSGAGFSWMAGPATRFDHYSTGGGGRPLGQHISVALAAPVHAPMQACKPPSRQVYQGTHSMIAGSLQLG